MGCFGKTKTQTYDPKHYGQFGQEGPDHEAIAMRDDLFSKMRDVRGAADQNSAEVVAKLKQGAADPGWGQIRDLATRTINGDYLSGSPQLTNQLNRIQAKGERAGADEEANIRSRFAKTGMNFGTANQQVSQQARALNRIGAGDTAANVMADNYGRERQFQNMAPNMLASAIKNPIELLQMVSPALYDRMTREGQLTTALAGGGQMVNPQVVMQQKPGMMDYIGQVLGMI